MSSGLITARQIRDQLNALDREILEQMQYGTLTTEPLVEKLNDPILASFMWLIEMMATPQATLAMGIRIGYQLAEAKFLESALDAAPEK